MFQRIRPLELLLELLDAGLPYTPATPEDLERRAPPLDWCLPMQMLVGAAAGAGRATLPPPPPPPPAANGPSTPPGARAQGQAQRTDEGEAEGSDAGSSGRGVSVVAAGQQSHGAVAGAAPPARTLPELLRSAPYFCFVHWYTGGAGGAGHAWGTRGRPRRSCLSPQHWHQPSEQARAQVLSHLARPP